MKRMHPIVLCTIVLLLFAPLGTSLYRNRIADKTADQREMNNALGNQTPSPRNETAHSVTYSLASNRSTGYEWHVLITEGNSVSVNENGFYREAPNPEMADGVGGTQHFEIFALKPGISILHFTYSRGIHDLADAFDLVAAVDDAMRITLQPLCENAD